MPCVGHHGVIVAFLGHIHLFFDNVDTDTFFLCTDVTVCAVVYYTIIAGPAGVYNNVCLSVRKQLVKKCL